MTRRQSTEDVAGDNQRGTDEEENVVLNKKLEVVKCEEDDDFIAELEKTMSSELASRTNTLGNPSGVGSLALPMNRTEERPHKNEAGQGNTMQFSVLLKKGTKQQFKTMDIPLDSEFASNLFDKQKVAREERERK